jgi:DeoR/GlpR family transcriptional regulator of sugar metabolism
MLPEERRRAILQYVRRSGSMDVAALSQRVRTSAATIRRDLRLLEQRGDLQRTHGGAVPSSPGTAFEPIYQEKFAEYANEKAAIALHAATLVRDGDVVTLDSGSTTFGLVPHLRALRNLTVITTDLKIAVALADGSAVEVIVVGGRVRPNLFSVVGPSAEASLDQLHADIAFLGADGIGLETGVTNANLDEAAIKRRVLRNSRRTVLLADHSKFGKTSLARVCDLDAFDEIVTDTGLSDEIHAPYAQRGARITRVG